MTKHPSRSRTPSADRDDTVPVPPRRGSPDRGRSRALTGIALAATMLLVNGLVGERGLTEMLRAKRSYAASVRDLAQLKRQNAALRDQVRRLRSDPATIEAAAREELGLVRPGEILVTIRDLKK